MSLLSLPPFSSEIHKEKIKDFFFFFAWIVFQNCIPFCPLQNRFVLEVESKILPSNSMEMKFLSLFGFEHSQLSAIQFKYSSFAVL